jgi:SAM-dependent methyltransferase
LPPEVDWTPLPRQPHALLPLLRALRPDYVHTHGKLSFCVAARLAAGLSGARFCADFNDIRILLRNHEWEAGAAEGTFERAEHWERPLSATEKSRIDTILELLPSVESLLDVGCGDGRITNLMAERAQRVVGLDASAQALSYVKTETVRSNVDELPFAERSFDLVTCIQVLEHLPRPVLRRTLSQLKRVARRYIMIGVPLDEPLHYRNLVCARCGHGFNQTGHLHRFNMAQLRRHFRGWRVVSQRSCGAEKRPYYNRALMLARRKLGGGNVRTERGCCPACGTPTWIDQIREKNLVTTTCDRYNGKIQRRLTLPRSHLVALFERP